MHILSKKRNEIIDTEILGRIFVRSGTVYAGTADSKPYYLGDYESDEQASMALRMVFEALNNPKNITYEMPKDEEVKARMANKRNDVGRHLANGAKQKGHGGS